MRLCFVGVHTHVHLFRWYRFFADRGHEVHVVSTVARESSIYEGVPISPFPVPRTGNYWLNFFLGFLGSPLYVFRLKRLLRNIQPDVVHVHYINDAALFSILSGFHPVIFTAWGTDVLISPNQSRLRKWILRYMLRKVDLVTCDADHMKKRLVELGADPPKTPVIFFGTDVEKFHGSKKDPVLRARFAPEGAPVVISIRNHETVYDIESVIKAAHRLIQKYPTAIFLMGGSGTLSESLRRLTDSLGLNENVKFLGSLTQDQLPVYLATADIYVSTSLSDGGLAASTAEAMASELPVVITDVGNNRQWVKDGQHGFVIAVRSPEDLAEKIAVLFESKPLRERMGREGRRVIVERNNLYNEMSRMEEFYVRFGQSSQKGEHPS